MIELAQTMFDIYALALPRGLAFGNQPPVGAWQSEDGQSFGAVTRNDDSGLHGVLVRRRRVDQVWETVCDDPDVGDLESARTLVETLLVEGAEPAPMPTESTPRPALYDVGDRVPSTVFRSLTMPAHYVAAWILNQLYLSLPAPDRNWSSDCQTANFHTRLWEAQLLASFREQGLLVTQPRPSPDFRIENRRGGMAWVEAVTANPTVPYDHVNAGQSRPPADTEELLAGPAAVRFAKTIGNKLERRYDLLDHVAGTPFAIALADFHAGGSMMWSREALITYLYGRVAMAVEVDGGRQAQVRDISHLLGDAAFPAGLFRNADHAELSAIIFTNACSVAKLSRVGVSAGAATNGLRLVRMGKFFDRREDALEGIPFLLDITSDAYRSLWPQGYEPWSAELEVFHNPFARRPLPFELLPEASHWAELDGELLGSSFYETSILWSRTLIQPADEPMPDLRDFTGTGDDEAV